jgi:hypothetical protein
VDLAGRLPAAFFLRSLLLCVAVMMASGWDHLGVFDVGLCGALVNLGVSVGMVFLVPTDVREQQRVQKRFFTLFMQPTSAVEPAVEREALASLRKL